MVLLCGACYIDLELKVCLYQLSKSWVPRLYIPVIVSSSRPGGNYGRNKEEILVLAGEMAQWAMSLFPKHENL